MALMLHMMQEIQKDVHSSPNVSVSEGHLAALVAAHLLSGVFCGFVFFGVIKKREREKERDR